MSKRVPSFVDLAHRTAVTGLVGLGVSFQRGAPCIDEEELCLLIIYLLYLPFSVSFALDLGSVAHSSSVEVPSR